MPPILSQILIAFLCATVGFIAGALIAILWTDRQKQEGPPTDVPEGLDPEKVEVIARLWREKESGKILTETEGKIYSEDETLKKADQKRLKQAALDWAGWLTGHTEKAPTPESEEVLQEPAHVTPPTPVVIPPETHIEQSFPAPIPLPPPPLPATLITPTKPPPVKPVSFFGALINPNVPVTEESLKKPKTIVEEIDALVQELLEDSPLKDRSIRLASDPAAGVIVWVGQEHYFGVDAVPDLEVKAFLRRAVAQWEKSNEKK